MRKGWLRATVQYVPPYAPYCTVCTVRTVPKRSVQTRVSNGEIHLHRLTVIPVYGTCGTYNMIHADHFEICGSFSSQLCVFRIWHYAHGTCSKYYTYSTLCMIRTVQTGHGCFEARLWYSTYGTVRTVHMVRYRTVHVVQYGTLHMVRYVWYVRYGTCGSS